MAELDPGLYEQLVTSRLRAAIDAIRVLLAVDEHPLNPADAADRIGWHIACQVELSLRDVSEQDRLSVGATVALVALGDWDRSCRPTRKRSCPNLRRIVRFVALQMALPLGSRCR